MLWAMPGAVCRAAQVAAAARLGSSGLCAESGRRMGLPQVLWSGLRAPHTPAVSGGVQLALCHSRTCFICVLGLEG